MSYRSLIDMFINHLGRQGDALIKAIEDGRNDFALTTWSECFEFSVTSEIHWDWISIIDEPQIDAQKSTCSIFFGQHSFDEEFVGYGENFYMYAFFQSCTPYVRKVLEYICQPTLFVPFIRLGNLSAGGLIYSQEGGVVESKTVSLISEPGSELIIKNTTTGEIYSEWVLDHQKYFENFTIVLTPDHQFRNFVIASVLITVAMLGVIYNV